MADDREIRVKTIFAFALLLILFIVFIYLILSVNDMSTEIQQLTGRIYALDKETGYSQTQLIEFINAYNAAETNETITA